MTDLKTLRLASLQLSPARLEGFVTYQRTLLAELARAAPPADWSGRYAFAHGRALSASGLDLVELGKLKALVAEYCGKRSAAQRVRERVARAQAGGGPGDAQLLERARRELHRLEDLAPFSERYGAEATALLQAREPELLALHRDLARQEGGGHLHPE